MPRISTRTIEDAREMAHKCDGYCLSTEYISKNEKLNWECAKGHNWQALYDNIEAGRWCPFCAGVKKRTLEYAIKLASDNNGKCLSKIYINNETDMEWECEKITNGLLLYIV